ncbi:MAG: hypothetical protein WDM85_16075 [Caulobacteraceae bacterium]
MNVLSPTVGFSKPKGPMTFSRTTLSLDLEDGRAAAFRLNTPRTRNLIFRRL